MLFYHVATVDGGGSTWLVGATQDSPSTEQEQDLDDIIQALDALGYDQAAQYVYGCDYSDWKKRHAKKASDEQM